MNSEVPSERPIGLESDWEKLRTITDEEIRAALESDPDINPTDQYFWRNAKIVIPQFHRHT